MARYSGRQGRVMLSTSGATNATAVLSLTSWSLDRTTDKIEVTSFGDANKVYVLGLPDSSGSLAGFWDDADDTVFTAADSPTGTKMYLYPDFSNAPTKYWYGPAFLDASIEVGVNDAVTIGGDFSASGNWGRK